MSSCSQFSLSQKEIGKSEITKKLQSVCLSSEGKGRLAIGKNKYLFGYESLNESKVKKWSLALELPLHGEELLSIDWSNAKNEEVSLDGDFYRRLLAQFRSNKKMKSLMKVFLLKTGQVIDARDQFLNKSVSYSCEQNAYDKYKKISFGECRNINNGFSFKWEAKSEDLKLILPIGGHFDYEIDFRNLNKKHFRLVAASLIKKKNHKKIFSMKLFIDTCHQ